MGGGGGGGVCRFRITPGLLTRGTACPLKVILQTLLPIYITDNKTSSSMWLLLSRANIYKHSVWPYNLQS